MDIASSDLAILQGDYSTRTRIEKPASNVNYCVYPAEVASDFWASVSNYGRLIDAGRVVLQPSEWYGGYLRGSARASSESEADTIPVLCISC